MAYGKFKDLTGKTAADKILLHKVFNIIKIPKYDGHQMDLTSTVYTFYASLNSQRP